MLDIALDNEDDVATKDEGEDAPKAAPQAPTAPDCPICYELMSPPTRIFQCGAGHLVCGTCRPRLQVVALYFVPCALGGKCFMLAKIISQFIFIYRIVMFRNARADVVNQCTIG